MLTRINTKRSILRAQERRRSKQPYWRPTIVGVITRNESEVLFVLSKGRGTWGLVKGGIEIRDHANVCKAVFREVQEEVSLGKNDFTGHRYLGTKDDGERDRRCHQIGQKLHFVHMRVKFEALPKANLKHHVSRYRWVTSLEEFNELPIRRHRRITWLIAMRAAGVTWTRPKECKGRHQI